MYRCNLVSCYKVNRFHNKFNFKSGKFIPESDLSWSAESTDWGTERCSLLARFNNSTETAFWESMRESMAPMNQSNTKNSCIRPTTTLDGTVRHAASVCELTESQRAHDLHPAVLSSLNDIQASKRVSDILVALEMSPRQSDAVTSESLYCISKLCSRDRNKNRLQSIIVDHRFKALVGELGSRIDIMAPDELCKVFWSLVKLKIFHETSWAIDLLKTITTTDTTKLSLESTRFALLALADIQKTSRATSNRNLIFEISRLTNACLGKVVSNIHSIPSTELISITTSLARLGRNEPVVMKTIADRIVNRIDTVSTEDLTSILWSFTTLKVVDSVLYSKIQGMLESRAPIDCSRRNLVELVWALAKGKPSTADGSLSELFKFTFAPLMRNHMLDMSVRELCTVLWSFATAEVVDMDFYNDVAHGLIPLVKEMNAHDVSSVVWGLAGVNYSHGDLFKSLRRQAVLLLHEFSPLQLSRVVYGLGVAGVNVDAFVEACIARMHLLYTQNIVEILIGISSGTEQGLELTEPFLETLEIQAKNISGRDAVQILKILGSLGYQNAFGRHKSLIDALEDIVRRRFNCSGRWIPNGYDVCDMVEAISRLRISDPDIIEPVLLHLGTVYKSPSFTAELFLKFLMAVSCFERDSAAFYSLKKLLLLREKGIQVAFSALSESLVERIMSSSNSSLDTVLDILAMYGKIGFADDSIVRLAELIQDNSDKIPEISISKQVSLVKTLAQLQLLPDFAFQMAQIACNKWLDSHIDSQSLDCVYDLIWARLALGDDPSAIPPQMLERMTTEGIYNNLNRAKQLYMSLSKYVEGPLAQEISTTILSTRRKEKSAIVDPKDRLSSSIDKYESLISFALSELGVKHRQRPYAIRNVYKVTATLDECEKVCLDLLLPTEVVSPGTAKWSGESFLKKLHLLNDGWTVISVTIPQVQKALEAGSLKAVVADLIAPYHKKGQARVSFKPIPGAEHLVESLLRRD
jgi:hypothetical protein